MRLFFISIFLLLLTSNAWGASITNATGQAAGTYNWSDSATWQGGVIPGHDSNANSDTVIINAPASGVITLIIDQNLTIGNPADNTTFGVLVKGVSATNYVRLQVADGVTVTFTGLTNYGLNQGYPLKVERYGRFEPQPGSAVAMDSASEMQNMALIQGTVYAVGTADKKITFTSPAARVNWNNSGTTTLTTAHEKQYWVDKNIINIKLDRDWIANADGTGPGDDSATGSTSINVSAMAPAGLFTTRKNYQLDANGLPDPTNLTEVGDYSINHDMGQIFVKVTDQNYAAISATIAYKYLTYTGWGIKLLENTTYNEGFFEHCNFEYMGFYTTALGSNYGGITVRYKNSAASAADRLFRFANNRVRYSASFLGLRALTGTAADPILIANNDFGAVYAVSSAFATLNFYAEASAYVALRDNLVKTYRYFVSSGGYSAIPIPLSNFTFTGNKIAAAQLWEAKQYGGAPMPDLDMSGNYLHGFGSSAIASSLVYIKHIYGTAGNPVLIHHNEFAHNYRTILHESHIKIYGNNFRNCNKHSNMMAASSLDEYLSDVDFYNNVAWGHGISINTSGLFQLGYNNRVWVDNIRCKNNTLYNAINGLELSDLDIGGSGTTNIVTVGTNIEYDNNIVHSMTTNGVQVGLGWNSRYNRTRLHLVSLDNNIVYNSGSAAYLNVTPGTFTWGGERYNLAATRNVEGVALHSASYSSPQTNKALALTVTTPGSDETLAWDGGTAIQLVQGTGSFTSAGTNPADGSSGRTPFGTVTDAAKTWQVDDFRDTDINTVTSPSAMWIKITSGTGAGQIRMIAHTASATTLRIVPAWDTLPQVGDTYTIYKSMVQLTDGAGTNTIMAGIDLRTLPTTSQTDTGISWANNSLTSDPLLANPASLSTSVNDYKITAGSPAIDAGTSLNAPATDYFDTSRTTADIGFFEFVSAANTTFAASGTVSGIGTSDTISTIQIIWQLSGTDANESAAISAGRTVSLTESSDVSAFQGSGYNVSISKLGAGTYTPKVRVIENRGAGGNVTGGWTAGSNFVIP